MGVDNFLFPKMTFLPKFRYHVIEEKNGLGLAYDVQIDCCFYVRCLPHYELLRLLYAVNLKVKIVQKTRNKLCFWSRDSQCVL